MGETSVRLLDTCLNSCIHSFRSSRNTEEIETAGIIFQTICEILHYKLIYLLKGELLLTLIGTLADAFDLTSSQAVIFTIEFLLITLLYRIEDSRYFNRVLKIESVFNLLRSNEILRRHFICVLSRNSFLRESLFGSGDRVEDLINIAHEFGDDYSHGYPCMTQTLKLKFNTIHRLLASSIQEKVIPQIKQVSFVLNWFLIYLDNRLISH